MSGAVTPMVPLGRSGVRVSRVAFGAVKIGRTAGLKYPGGFTLPSQDGVDALLDALVTSGITTLDTAPAYGLSEQRIGDWLRRRGGPQALAGRTLCSKTGETFDPETASSAFDFSAGATRASVSRSLDRLGVDALDVVHVHSSGDDLAIQDESGCVDALRALRDDGAVRAIGFSGKTVEGTRRAIDWADSVMVTLHADDTSHLGVIEEAAAAGVGVMVKKGMGSGHLPAREALRFLGGVAGVSSVVIGSLSAAHMRQNAAWLAGADA